MFGKSLRNFEEIFSMFDEAMWIIQRIFEWDDFARNDLSQQVFIDHWRHIWTHPESYPSTHTKSIHRNRGKHKRENDSRKSNSRSNIRSRKSSPFWIIHCSFDSCGLFVWKEAFLVFAHTIWCNIMITSWPTNLCRQSLHKREDRDMNCHNQRAKDGEKEERRSPGKSQPSNLSISTFVGKMFVGETSLLGS